MALGWPDTESHNCAPVGCPICNGAHWRREAQRFRDALLEVERHCPCGARPESPNTHPHVTGCPVGNALHPRLIDGSEGGLADA